MASERASAPFEEQRPVRSVGTMQSTSKLLAILRLFTAAQPEWTVEDGADALGMPVSTAYRYFRELNEAGLIGSTAAGRYILGPAIMELDRQTRLQESRWDAFDKTINWVAVSLAIVISSAVDSMRFNRHNPAMALAGGEEGGGSAAWRVTMHCSGRRRSPVPATSTKPG